jgi:hypothetical protein
MRAQVLMSPESRVPTAVPEFEFRSRRDLLGRRIVREGIRKLARVAILLAADALAVVCTLVVLGLVTGTGRAIEPLFFALWAILALSQAGLGMYGGWSNRHRQGRIVAASVLSVALVQSLDLLLPPRLVGLSVWGLFVLQSRPVLSSPTSAGSESVACW